MGELKGTVTIQELGANAGFLLSSTGKQPKWSSLLPEQADKKKKNINKKKKNTVIDHKTKKKLSPQWYFKINVWANLQTLELICIWLSCRIHSSHDLLLDLIRVELELMSQDAGAYRLRLQEHVEIDSLSILQNVFVNRFYNIYCRPLARGVSGYLLDTPLLILNTLYPYVLCIMQWDEKELDTQFTPRPKCVFLDTQFTPNVYIWTPNSPRIVYFWTPNSPQMYIFGQPILKSWLKCWSTG